MSVTELMLLIKSLDPHAHVALSEFTHDWYVSADIHISNGDTLTSVVEHAADPASAITSFVNRICEVRQVSPVDDVLVTKHHGQRREWAYNGVAFVEVTGYRDTRVAVTT